MLQESIIKLGESATEIISEYFDKKETDGERVNIAIRILDKSTRILHMNQVRELRDRSHALQLLRFLPNEEVKKKYIEITNPQIAGLLQDRPK